MTLFVTSHAYFTRYFISHSSELKTIDVMCVRTCALCSAQECDQLISRL